MRLDVAGAFEQLRLVGHGSLAGGAGERRPPGYVPNLARWFGMTKSPVRKNCLFNASSLAFVVTSCLLGRPKIDGMLHSEARNLTILHVSFCKLSSSSHFESQGQLTAQKMRAWCVPRSKFRLRSGKL